MKLNVMNFNTSESTNPDLMKFSATACYLDTPTDGTPEGGYEDYKVVIASDSAKVDSLVGMGVNCYWSDGWFSDGSDNLKGHNPWFKIGVITAAEKKDNAVEVEGHLWKKDFADICDTIQCAKDSLGCSVEVYFDGVNINTAEKIQTGIGANFTGMAILYKDKAAFKSTDFMCALKKEDNMTQEDMKALSESISKTMDEKLSEFAKKQEERFTALESKFNMQDNADDTADGAEGADNAASLSDKNSKDSDDTASEGMKLEDIKKAMTDAISEAFASHDTATRKTVTDTETVKQFGGDKSVMEMSAEIDKDASKSASQKWSAQLALWNQHKAEM